jgi:glycine oxidase
MRIGIAGGGLLGRLCAFHLSQAGHRITIFEANASPAPAVNSIRAAAWTAAGMLSPIAEMECGGSMVRDLGKRSLVLWQAMDQQLRTVLSSTTGTNGISAASAGAMPTPPTDSRDLVVINDQAIDDHDANGSPLGLRLHDSLMVCHASDMGSAQRVLRLLDQDDRSMIKLDAHDIVPLAPALKGTLHAWRLLGEGHLYPHQAMRSFYQAMPDVEWRWGTSAHRIEPHSVQTGQETLRYDWVIDARGVGAASEMPVRGVRGELLVLFAPGFELHRPVRLLHPRWRVYIVPRPGRQIVIGATEIESEDRSSISVQSTMELLSATFSIFPSLAEARILWSDVNLRPATPDNLPVIHTEPGLSRINGLFRHGWLLGPAVVEKAMHDAGLH